MNFCSMAYACMFSHLVDMATGRFYMLLKVNTQIGDIGVSMAAADVAHNSKFSGMFRVKLHAQSTSEQRRIWGSNLRQIIQDFSNSARPKWHQTMGNTIRRTRSRRLSMAC
jgi:hypothetical protein